jgi:hypothetical protein
MAPSEPIGQSLKLVNLMPQNCCFIFFGCFIFFDGGHWQHALRIAKALTMLGYL